MNAYEGYYDMVHGCLRCQGHSSESLYLSNICNRIWSFQTDETIHVYKKALKSKKLQHEQNNNMNMQEF